MRQIARVRWRIDGHINAYQYDAFSVIHSPISFPVTFESWRLCRQLQTLRGGVGGVMSRGICQFPAGPPDGALTKHLVLTASGRRSTRHANISTGTGVNHASPVVVLDYTTDSLVIRRFHHTVHECCTAP